MEFVITGLDNWESIGSFNSKNIAQELSKKHKVLFVNPPMDRLTLIRQNKSLAKKAPKEDVLEEVEKNIWVLSPGFILESINKIPFAWIFDFLNKRNNKRFSVSIAAAIQKLGFQYCVFFNDNDIFKSFYLKELLKPSLYVYYMRDNFTAVNYWKRHGSRLEPKLMRKADIVLTNSTYYEDMAKQHNLHAYYIGQGCDFSVFSEENILRRPSELKGIKRPVIGYVGAISSLRLDIDLISYIARERRDYSIVLVGPVDDDFKNSTLNSLPNVIFTGAKKQEELPGYIHEFDVAINPQKVNDITIGNYPRKVDEYLALGKPVVATRTQAMCVFKDFVYLAGSHADYVHHIDKALGEDGSATKKQRIAFAKSHSWENSVNLLYEKVERILENETAVA